jgi:hypothetical protein
MPLQVEIQIGLLRKIGIECVDGSLNGNDICLQSEEPLIRLMIECILYTMTLHTLRCQTPYVVDPLHSARLPRYTLSQEMS